MPPFSDKLVTLAISPEGRMNWQVGLLLDSLLLLDPQRNVHVELTQPPQTAIDGVTGHVQFPLGQSEVSGVAELVKAPT